MKRITESYEQFDKRKKKGKLAKNAIMAEIRREKNGYEIICKGGNDWEQEIYEKIEKEKEKRLMKISEKMMKK